MCLPLDYPHAGLLIGILLRIETGISRKLHKRFDATATSHIIVIYRIHPFVLRHHTDARPLPHPKLYVCTGHELDEWLMHKKSNCDKIVK